MNFTGNQNDGYFYNNATNNFAQASTHAQRAQPLRAPRRPRRVWVPRFFFSTFFFSVGYLQVILLICRFPPGNCKGSAPSRFLTFSVSNFSIIFGMPFFRHFTPLGTPLAPRWLLLGILYAFWAPFWLPFGSLLLQICIPFSNPVFALILH